MITTDRPATRPESTLREDNRTSSLPGVDRLALLQEGAGLAGARPAVPGATSGRGDVSSPAAPASGKLEFDYAMYGSKLQPVPGIDGSTMTASGMKTPEDDQHYTPEPGSTIDSRKTAPEPTSGKRSDTATPVADQSKPESAGSTADQPSRAQQLNDTYGPRSAEKYAGLSDEQIKQYRALDEGLGPSQPGGPGGKGWDAAIQPGSPADLAEKDLKSTFDKMKLANAKDGSAPSQAQKDALDALNRKFFEALGGPDYRSNPELATLEQLYSQRNFTLLGTADGKSSDM